ncbi:MAG: hypothetical protein ACFB0D_07530 [Phormidesmis sp.]
MSNALPVAMPVAMPVAKGLKPSIAFCLRAFCDWQENSKVAITCGKTTPWPCHAFGVVDTLSHRMYRIEEAEEASKNVGVGSSFTSHFCWVLCYSAWRLGMEHRFGKSFGRCLFVRTALTIKF